MKRDPNLIPKKLLKVAERAQVQLEMLPADQRVAFIKKKSHIWRAFKRHLRAMSYGKCWYSEAKGPQSPYDVDHFRPKSEAQRSETVKDEGYPWLAFDWDNFRYSAERSNRPSTDEETGEVVGKSSWFPLVDGSPIAIWDDRCTKNEVPLLLDPVCRKDVSLIDVGSDGRMRPSITCVGTGKKRVKASIRHYALNLPDILEARQDVMRDVNDRVETLLKSIEAANSFEEAADAIPVEDQRKAITALTMPNSAFARAARAKLIEKGLAGLIAPPEDYPAIVA
ncbi:hypothetical protein [Pseudaminobacter soli (ex Li et al. 2025)]|uniref:hypothetical protein n=1 Tax=Pseudaminobacter soli (ex Li et al. 2025) TaxID=1295366 RepID=UPI001FE16173|nr:hypothetical protein [Mesorhizobium soli]